MKEKPFYQRFNEAMNRVYPKDYISSELVVNGVHFVRVLLKGGDEDATS